MSKYRVLYFLLSDFSMYSQYYQVYIPQEYKDTFANALLWSCIGIVLHTIKFNALTSIQW